MADRKDHLFEIVRRGYDVDEVKRYLDELNGWWASELEHAVAERDGRITELEKMTTEVAAARQERESLARMLTDAGEQRRQILEEAELKASRLVSDTEREMAKVRRDTEAAMAELRHEADAKKEDKLSAAATEARSMIDQAKATIASIEKQSQRRLTDEELATEARIESRSKDAERKHNAKVREYARVETELTARIEHLQNVRESLISSLEAIARGALQSVEEAPAEDLSVAAIPEHGDEEDALVTEIDQVESDSDSESEPSVELSA